MSYDAISLFVPVVYAALQFDAVRRMQNSWKSAAYLPVGLMTVAFTFQILLGIASPAVAAWIPLAAMTASCIYLAALNLIHDRTLRDAMKDAGETLAENVVFLDDYRTQG